ncbi:hypothetical protein [Klebsiella pneumoniae]|uniref:hypothetical protein n=1 Tax=Klebsiella pneumoniae TaxID=573 RepID=UPI0013E9261B|nr:hypothetical protein [Klebsiella pneumoniae]
MSKAKQTSQQQYWYREREFPTAAPVFEAVISTSVSGLTEDFTATCVMHACG